MGSTSSDMLQLNNFRSKNDLDANSDLLFESYSVVGDRDVPVNGLLIHPPSRLGNLLLQYITAILLAERTGLCYIVLAQHELCEVTNGLVVQNITYFGPKAGAPDDACLMRGQFFHYAPSPFAPVVPALSEPDEVEYSRVCREIIRPYLLTGLVANKDPLKDELTIHIRAGDVFTGQDSVAGYRQPPLSFYKLVVEKLSREGKIDKVRLVFEDRGNPCVEALESYLAEKRIPYISQSRTLGEDLSAMIDAPHLVFGFGTFGYAACRLSNKVKTIHFFGPELLGSYAQIPIVDEVFSVHDFKGDYFRAYHQDWHNTPDQRRVMLDFPVEGLIVTRLK